MENNKIDNTQLEMRKKFIIYFFIYSALGWILETIFCLITLGVFNKRGFLYGPVCPIYGFGAILLIQCLHGKKVNIFGKFFIAMIAFTFIEYVASAVLEDLFGLRWWDYSNDILNFQGRISLPYSIAWGVMGVIFVEIIHPVIQRCVENLIKKVSTKKQNIILNILVLIILVDFTMSVIKYIKI